MIKLVKIPTILLLTFSVILSSCDNTPPHEHTFSSSYEYDDTYHWHPSTCGHDVQSEKEMHIFASSITEPTYEHEGYTTYRCLVCGYSYTDDEVDALPITITWKNYDGTMIVVSHNPEFVDNLGIERLLILPEGKISYYDRDIVEHYQTLNKRIRR